MVRDTHTHAVGLSVGLLWAAASVDALPNLAAGTTGVVATTFANEVGAEDLLAVDVNGGKDPK